MHLKYSDPASRTNIDLELPEDKVLEALLPGADMQRAGTCCYSITGIEHLARHADCLINILHTASVSQMNPGRHIMSLTEHIPWLVDSLEELNEERKRWRHHCQYSPFVFLEWALGLARSPSSLNDLVLQKLYTIMVLITADVAGQPEQLTSPVQDEKSARRTLALSLAHLAGAVIGKRPIAKLVAAKLLKPLEHFSTSVEQDIPKDLGDLAVRRPLRSLVSTFLTFPVPAFRPSSPRGCKPPDPPLLQRRSCAKCIRRRRNTLHGEDNRTNILYSFMRRAA